MRTSRVAAGIASALSLLVVAGGAPPSALALPSVVGLSVAHASDDCPAYHVGDDDGYDRLLKNYHVPTGSARLWVRAEPLKPASAQPKPADILVGAGTSWCDGTVLVAENNISEVTGNPAYEAIYGDITLDVYYDDGDGNQTFAFSVPENFGAYSNTDDPTLIAQQVMSNGSPVANAPVTVSLVPLDQSTWSSQEPFPVISTGTTNADGYVEAKLNDGLDGYQDNPAFQSESTGQITMSVSYVDSDGNTHASFTANEDLDGFDDPMLAQHALTIPGGSSVLADTRLTVYAEGQYTATGWPQSNSYQQIAICSTDTSGVPACPIDLRNIQGNSTFEHYALGVVTYDIWADIGGHQTFVTRLQEDLSGQWNYYVQSQMIPDDGNPLAGMDVTVMAQPNGATDPSDWSEAESYLDVGDGISGAGGVPDVSVNLTRAINDPTYNLNGLVTLDVYWSRPPECPDGHCANDNQSPQFAFSVWEDIASTPEWEMAQQTITDGAGKPVGGAITLARLEPVRDTGWRAGEGPVVGMGITNAAGSVTMTPDLADYANNGTYVTDNEILLVDVYQQDTGNETGWDFVTRVPYYMGGTDDPILAHTEVRDRDGNPVEHKSVIIRATPTDPSECVDSGCDPTVGSGNTTTTGMVNGTVDLSHIMGNSNFERAGTFDLAVYYLDRDDNLLQGASAHETFTGTGDLLVAPPVVDQHGDPIAATDIVLKAEPIADGTGPFDPADQPTVGSGETDSEGSIDPVFDISQVAGNSEYVTHSRLLNVGVFTSNGSSLRYVTSITEYIGPSQDAGGTRGCATICYQRHVEVHPSCLVNGSATPIKIWLWNGQPYTDFSAYITWNDGFHMIEPHDALQTNQRGTVFLELTQAQAQATEGAGTYDVYFTHAANWHRFPYGAPHTTLTVVSASRGC